VNEAESLRYADVTSRVIVIGEVPHTWLFPQMTVICQHGGAGISTETTLLSAERF
jgi:UDP:flavonoid glycosyltransferase YjiC (YdhE family)